jgi:selenocysteine lyase/cysteine desulfurase
MKLLGICVSLAVCTLTEAGPASFGHSLLPLFGFRAGYKNLNHGSYGSCPKSVTDNQTAWIRQCEENPDLWYRSGLGFDTALTFQDRVRAKMAAYINADFNDTVFVDNASNGVNAVMRSLARSLPPGKKIMLLNTAYYMVKMVLQYLEPSQTLMVNISLPSSNAQILAAVGVALAGNDVYAASFSHIVSVPAVILPVKDLTALCHAHGALVLIDGAHALGQIPVDVTDTGADFWLGNGHKWFVACPLFSRFRKEMLS